jgi:hypothetical protein
MLAAIIHHNNRSRFDFLVVRSEDAFLAILVLRKKLTANPGWVVHLVGISEDISVFRLNLPEAPAKPR